MGKAIGLGLIVLVVAAAVVFALNGWNVNVGEWAGELADWIMSRDEQQSQ